MKNSLPSIKTPKSERRKILAGKLENFLQECETLHDSSKLQENLSKDFQDFNQKLEELKIPGVGYETDASSKKIDEYIRQKLLSDSDSLDKPLPNLSNLRFSFADCSNNASPIFSKQKRKFGRHCMGSLDSCDTENSNLFDVNQNIFNKSAEENLSKQRKSFRNKKVEFLIKDLMNKRLGLKYIEETDKKISAKNNKILKFDKIVNKKPASDKKRNSLAITVYKEKESEYLDTDYNEYIKSPVRRIRLEKLLISHHQKYRKNLISQDLYK
jgi:hypothetical protein